MAAKYVKTNRASGEKGLIAQAMQVLSGGQVAVVPTETLYGVIGRADHPEALSRLRKIRAGSSRAMTLHVGKPEQALPFIEAPTPYIRHAMSALWPGPVSLVFSVPEAKRGSAGERAVDPADLYDHGSLTVRCPSHTLTRQILESCEHPVVGAALPHDATRVDRLSDEARAQIGLIIDDGTPALGKPSTLIRLHDDHFDIVRVGVYDRRIIEKMLQTTILFVCSGNTCRSPMAEAIARKVIADSLKITEAELGKAGYTVVSAGASGLPGSPATENAVEAVRQMGGDLSRHRSRALTRQLVEGASVIFAMGRSHMEVVKMLSPTAIGKVSLLDPEGDIEDPIGGDFALYRSLAEKIKGLIDRRLAGKSLLGQER